MSVYTFGEIMLRLSTPANRRFLQVYNFEVSYAGAEASVAVSLSIFGIKTSFVTCLPVNDLGQAAINQLKRYGVGTSQIIRCGKRIGVYFYEIGANQRPSKVIYDRSNSAFAEIDPKTIQWNELFKNAKWFHFTGITPAISQSTADACIEAVRSAKKNGLTVSCDLNFRSKLWKYGKPPSQIMSLLLKYVDVAIGNEEDCEKIFNIKGADVEDAKDVTTDKYLYVVKQLYDKFPNLSKICITLRGSVNANYNNWTAILYDTYNQKMYTTKNYEITDIVDRLGGGDAFAAGIIYSLMSGKEYQESLDFAVAASALKHSIFFDFNLATVDEIENLLESQGSGRIQR